MKNSTEFVTFPQVNFFPLLKFFSKSNLIKRNKYLNIFEFSEQVNDHLEIHEIEVIH